MKRGDFVRDDCGCIYKVTSVVKDSKSRVRRVWFRHRDDTKSFYMSRRDMQRLKRVK
jgi:hypothetical protein